MGLDRVTEAGMRKKDSKELRVFQNFVVGFFQLTDQMTDLIVAPIKQLRN